MFSNLEKKKFQITLSTKIQGLWGIGIDIFCKTSAAEMPIPISRKHKKNILWEHQEKAFLIIWWSVQESGRDGLYPGDSWGDQQEVGIDFVRPRNYIREMLNDFFILTADCQSTLLQ